MCAPLRAPSAIAQFRPTTCPKWAVSPKAGTGRYKGAQGAASRVRPGPSGRCAGWLRPRPMQSASVGLGPVRPSPDRTGLQACDGLFPWEDRSHPKCGRQTSRLAGRHSDPFGPEYAPQYAFVPERPGSAPWSGRPRIPARSLTGVPSRTERSDIEPLRNCVRTHQGPAARAYVSGPVRVRLRRSRSRCTFFSRDAAHEKAGRQPFTGRRPCAGQKSNSSPRKLSRRFFL